MPLLHNACNEDGSSAAAGGRPLNFRCTLCAVLLNPAAALFSMAVPALILVVCVAHHRMQVWDEQHQARPGAACRLWRCTCGLVCSCLHLLLCICLR